jgi:hypothetical protein
LFTLHLVSFCPHLIICHEASRPFWISHYHPSEQRRGGGNSCSRVRLGGQMRLHPTRFIPVNNTRHPTYIAEPASSLSLPFHPLICGPYFFVTKIMFLTTASW